MSLPNLLACVPPQAGHIDELSILLEEGGYGIRIARIPGCHKGANDIFRSFKRPPIHRRRAWPALESAGPPPVCRLFHATDRSHMGLAASMGDRLPEMSPPVYGLVPLLESSVLPRACVYSP